MLKGLVLTTCGDFQRFVSWVLLTRFYQNLLRRRAGLSKGMPKAEALSEAKRWLRSLKADEIGGELAALAYVAQVVANFTPKRRPIGEISWVFRSENSLRSL